MDLLEKMKSLKKNRKFGTYFFFLMVFQFGAYWSRVYSDYSFVGIIVWYSAYFILNIILGYESKTWKETVAWLIMAPLFATLILFGSNTEIGAIQFFLILILIYGLSWALIAFFLDKQQYSCATAAIIAFLTTIGGIYAFCTFFVSTGALDIGKLPLEKTNNLVAITFSVIYIAEKWGKFFLELKSLYKI